MRLIDADKLKRHYSWWNDTEKRKLFNDIVDAQPTVQQWIPSERLPEKNGSYLIQVDSSDGTATITFMAVDHFNEDGTWLHCDDKRHKVVAWMPLPERYKAESEEI